MVGIVKEHDLRIVDHCPDHGDSLHETGRQDAACAVTDMRTVAFWQAFDFFIKTKLFGDFHRLADVFSAPEIRHVVQNGTGINIGIRSQKCHLAAVALALMFCDVLTIKHDLAIVGTDKAHHQFEQGRTAG